MSQVPASLLRAWSGLGVAFAENEAANPDPEKTLLESLVYFSEDRKLLSLALVWAEVFGELIHLERLKSLSKTLNPSQWAWLGGFAAKCAKQNPRWKMMVKLAEKEFGNPMPRFPALEREVQIIRIKGSDPEFAAFGISIPELQTENARKLKTRDYVLTNHTWLRLRLMFGTNWRADSLWALTDDSIANPYQLMKRTGSSYFTAHTLWKTFQELEIEPKKVVGIL